MISRPTASFLVSCIVSSLALAAVAVAQDPFAENIRTTEPLSAGDEQKTFQLPPGFEIQLVASEPEILKPLNMAFDARGRLWITETVEYPYAAPADRKGRDNIKILEDTDGDGRADKFTVFADGLNIPIGLYPYDGGAVAFSIPNIMKFEDTDGDDVADLRTKLYGPFDYSRDTHGLNNAFRRGFDGWIYACHGFNNQSKVQGTDGHRVELPSGNTYRFRLDGSRIENFAHGQVNPFGMSFDPLGNLFSADCHSKPIYQLLRGGCYPSFGRPHDGLGFVPAMMNHSHGSTAICGVAHYSGENFPHEYRDNLFTGNVMTSRVNRNKLVYHGSTILAQEAPDFLATTDPWFRPVDIQLGPDGALYVADFYNRIIGHYEVSLNDPRRDRDRGRIWRIIYTGDAAETNPAKMPPSLSAASPDQLVAALGDPNLTRRMLATNQITDKAFDDRLVRDVFGNSDSAPARAHALWLLHRHDAKGEFPARDALLDRDPMVRVHALKIMSETGRDHLDLKLIQAGLDDPNAFVKRAAADALGQHPDLENVAPLLTSLAKVPADDVLLRHTIRMALRNHFAVAGVSERLREMKLTPQIAGEMASIALGYSAPTRSSSPPLPDESAEFIIFYLANLDQISKEELLGFLNRAFQRIGRENADLLADHVQRRFADDFVFQSDVLALIEQGLRINGGKSTDKISAWTRRVVSGLLDSVAGGFDGWVNTPIPYKAASQNPWRLQQRASADGDHDSNFLCTLPAGESATGQLRSAPFEIPPQLTFYSAGHIGDPRAPVVAMNFIRLRDAKSHAVLAESRPPRNDVAQPITWKLADHRGQSGYLEIVDGDDRPSYAWLAVGRFDPPLVALPKMSGSDVADRKVKALQLAGAAHMTELRPRLVDWIRDELTDAQVRRGAATLLCAFDEQPAHISGLANLIAEPSLSPEAREKLCRFLADPKQDDAVGLLADAARTSSAQFQDDLARNLSAFRDGGELLLQLVEKGHVSRRLLLSEETKSRINGAKVKDAQSRMDALTAGLQPRSDEIRQLVETRQRQFVSRPTSLEIGSQLFTKSCAACHQLDGKGPVIGPQLDGIGNRGADRIIEDILDPNRNIDVAFQTTSLTTTDGKVFSGLFRREQGQLLVFADNQGKEFSVDKDQVDETKKTHLSLMPENLAQSISEQDFYDLLSYLLTKRGQPLTNPAPPKP